MFDDLAHELHRVAKEKGFWDANTEDTHIIFYLKQIAMIHSEASEILEAIRKSKGEREVVTEIADLLIRSLDLWAGMKADGYVTSSLDEVLEEKSGFNKTRERMHGVLA